MFMVDNLGHIAHKLEDLMQLIDQDNSILALHPGIVDLLFRGNAAAQTGGGGLFTGLAHGVLPWGETSSSSPAGSTSPI